MKILLTDASGLTSRQLAIILSRKNHTVHVLSPPGITLTKFTSHVTKIHTVPLFRRDPYVWFDAILCVIKAEPGSFDILVCTQEMVSIISAELPLLQKLGVHVAVPSFSALRRVMGKIAAKGTLEEAGLPQPDSAIIERKGMGAEKIDVETGLFPGWLKTDIGTASQGVRRVSDVPALRIAMSEPQFLQTNGEMILQKEIQGKLLMISAVFSRGKLLAWHACLRLHEGVGGGASKKISLPLPIIATHLIQLGSLLSWHGALSLDAILKDGKDLFYIDINPRIVEPMNALLSGVDLVQTLLDVSLQYTPYTVSSSFEGIHAKHGIEGAETHQGLLALLRATEHGRFFLLLEAFKIVFGLGMYKGSKEELVPVECGDLWSILVMGGLVLGLILGGRRMELWLRGGSVGGYALGEEGWRLICEKVDRREGKGGGG
ncbi:hypothetical protein BGZ60DRAFT_525203 [Tricladium varicosporioides]|nr:hypothetical protein BGZ60DRAFT_525203 [Hymenoscyphus varicosporioides]